MGNSINHITIKYDQTILDELNNLPKHYHAAHCITLCQVVLHDNNINTILYGDICLDVVYIPQFNEYGVRHVFSILPTPFDRYIQQHPIVKQCDYVKFLEENGWSHPVINDWLTSKNILLK